MLLVVVSVALSPMIAILLIADNQMGKIKHKNATCSKYKTSNDVATVKRHYPPPNSVHIHCLFSDEFFFFVWKNSMKYLLLYQMPFCSTAILPLSVAKQNITGY